MMPVGAHNASYAMLVGHGDVQFVVLVPTTSLATSIAAIVLVISSEG